MKEKKDSETRKVYLDYLRIFATFAVMILHISAINWYKADVNSYNWQVLNEFDSLVRWGVLVFVMISGALFLNKDIPTKKIYSKYILRLVLSFIAWALVYAIFKEGAIKNKISVAIEGHYHMWFIFMIIGLYMCIPFIKAIIQDNKRLKYYLSLSIIFAYTIPLLIVLLEDFGNSIIIRGLISINYHITSMNMHMVLGFAGCFVLGYYIDKINLNKKVRSIIYILGVLGFLFTICMTSIVSIKTQHFCEHYHDYFTLNVLLEAIAVFTMFKYRSYKNEKLNWFIQKLSKYSFGAYLVHILVLEKLESLTGLNTLSFNPLLSVIVIGFIVYTVSFIISTILNHIPIVKKYLV